MARKPHRSGVSDEEWAFAAPYLALMTGDAPQREHSLREVLDGLRYIVHTSMQRQSMAHDLPPWYTVYQPRAKLAEGGCVRGCRTRPAYADARDRGLALLPHGEILDSRALQSSPEGGERAGNDGFQWRKGSKVHLVVDALGQLLASIVTPANEQDRVQVSALAAQAQEVTSDSVEVAFVDRGCTGEQPAADAQAQGIRPEVVKLATTKRGFVVLPRR